MKQYFLHDGQNQLGPFSSDELKERNINGETYVWKEGMKEWVKAKEIPELTGIFINTPPPFKSSVSIPEPPLAYNKQKKPSTTYSAGTWIGRNWKKVSLFIILIIIGGIIIYNNQRSGNNYYSPFSDSSAREKTQEELRIELQMMERENPEKYLKSDLTRRKNLIGESVIEGTITNTASIATFKDIKIKITFISKTKSVIGSIDFVIYEVIGPQQTISIKKQKVFAPSNTDGFAADVVSAIPVD